MNVESRKKMRRNSATRLFYKTCNRTKIETKFLIYKTLLDACLIQFDE